MGAAYDTIPSFARIPPEFSSLSFAGGIPASGHGRSLCSRELIRFVRHPSCQVLAPVLTSRARALTGHDAGVPHAPLAVMAPTRMLPQPMRLLHQFLCTPSFEAIPGLWRAVVSCHAPDAVKIPREFGSLPNYS